MQDPDIPGDKSPENEGPENEGPNDEGPNDKPPTFLELARYLRGRTITVASRAASASPATGSNKRSATEQADLINRALTL